MKIEIEKREYDRLKSREEKLLAYYEWWREGEGMELKSIEEVINDNIRLRAEIKNLKEYKSQRTRKIERENKKLKSDLGTVIDERDNNIKQNKKLRERIKELETDYDRLKVAFEDVVSGK